MNVLVRTFLWVFPLVMSVAMLGDYMLNGVDVTDDEYISKYMNPFLKEREFGNVTKREEGLEEDCQFYELYD